MVQQPLHSAQVPSYECRSCTTGSSIHLVGIARVALEPQPVRRGLAGVAQLGLGVLHSQHTKVDPREDEEGVWV